ncbi:TPA: polysaccharide deacetylase, partial [Candidatus Sumerlaeota bacterium]|nr:polysaccharide deacetylase [Candidatus Sumerlaeota bacterium]
SVATPTAASTAAVTSGTKTVYLTFDDGPTALTPKVLDILKEKGVHATFFVIGGTNAEYYKRIVDEGHAIGNHTYSHNTQIYKSPELFVADLKKQEDLIFNFTGVRTDIMRFPNGSNNWNGGKNGAGLNRMVDIRPAVEQAGYAYFDWNASGIDYDAKIGKTKEQILTNIKTTTKQGTKSYRIVLLHDGSGHGPTVEALPEIIDFYQSQGYQFETLKHDSDTVHFPIATPKPKA